MERMVVIFPPPSSPPSSGNARERELQHWDRLEERGVTARLATFQRTQVSLTQATDLASASVRNTSTRVWLVYLACLFSCRHTRYITFVLLCLTQTNKPSLRLSISPKKGYVVKFSTVATEWLRVHRSRGNGFGNL